MFRNVLVWLVIALVLLSVFQSLSQHAGSSQELVYSEFLKDVRADNVQSVMIGDDRMTLLGSRRDGSEFRTVAPYDDGLINELDKHSVRFEQIPIKRNSFLVDLLLNALPFVIFIAVLIYMMRQMQAGAGGRGAMNFGRSRARLQGEDQVKVTFADVAGVDEA